MNPEVYKSKSTVPSVYEPFRFFDEFARDFFAPTFIKRDGRADLRTDIIDEGNRYVLQANLPGFRKEDIRLDVNADTLTLCAMRETARNSEDTARSYVRMERSYGTYKRQFDMTGIDTEKIQASYADGVLTLSLPKKEDAPVKTRTVTIE